LKQLDPDEIRIGVMQYITSSMCKPHYYAEEVTDWFWFLYPWNWIEDTTTLIVRLMSEDDKIWSSTQVHSGLQTYFEIKWDQKMLSYILKIMEEREQVETARSAEGIKYKLKKKSVIQL